MFRSLTAAGLAAAIALLPAPAAQAGGDDVAKVLAGLAALAVIGIAIDKHNDKKKKTVVVPVHPRPLPPTVHRYTLPKTCTRTVWKDGEQIPVLGGTCLSKRYTHYAGLPKSCEFRHWNSRKGVWRYSYGQSCLERHGYRVARH